MKIRSTAYLAAAFFAVAACGQPADGQAAAQGNESANDGAFEAVSGQYAPDQRHRYITFSYEHFGYSRPSVRWREWDATLDWNAENPEASSVEVTIDAESVDTGVDVFDGHLNGERFFDTANYPEITFISTNIQRTGDNAGVITGDLTIKDITKPVSLDVTLRRAALDERAGYKLGFSGKTVVNRSEFGLDYLVPGVSDEVEIVIETEFVMPAGDGE